jgi:LuxR family maltose regulon positive regulatory protein
MDHMLQAGHIADILGLAITMADIRIVQGRLGDAMHTYEHALRLAAQQDRPTLRGTADMYVGMAALHRERGDLPAATQLLLQSQELGEHLGLPQNPYRWRVAMARVQEAEGDLDGAVDLLDDAERVYVGDFSPNVRPIPAVRVRVWLAQGRLDDALRWARDQRLSVDDDLTYLREFEHLTLVRLLLAHNRADRPVISAGRALELLQRLLHAAEAGGRTGSVIEILALQALAHHALGDTTSALVALDRSLTLAEPEGYARLFVDEGPPMTALLQKAAAGRAVATYVQRLLTGVSVPPPHPTAPSGLVQPLSDREMDVLRLLRTDLGGPEIARELVVSLNTVRTHTKNIFAKLGVNNRRAAITRSEELGLLGSRGSRRGALPPSAESARG